MNTEVTLAHSSVGSSNSGSNDVFPVKGNASAVAPVNSDAPVANGHVSNEEKDKDDTTDNDEEKETGGIALGRDNKEQTNQKKKNKKKLIPEHPAGIVKTKKTNNVRTALAKALANYASGQASANALALPNEVAPDRIQQYLANALTKRASEQQHKPKELGKPKEPVSFSGQQRKPKEPATVAKRRTHSQSNKYPSERLCKPQIKKLIYLGWRGATGYNRKLKPMRIPSQVYWVMRFAAASMVYPMIGAAAITTRYANRETVNTSAFVHAANIQTTNNVWL